MKHIEKYFGLFLLLFAVGFNLWLYRLEPTAKVDPNDNTFQFALVERTNQIYDFAQQKCSGIFKPFCTLSLLTDHWVPNWAEGYNLPYYYSHIPQITLVLSYRLFSMLGLHISLFQYYHGVIYLLLALFPLSVFLSLRIIGLPWLAAGTGAILASLLSTDGLYGLDPTSFLWRGYGLSSQLFSMIWLPLTIAYASKRRTLPALITLAATTAGHLGIGIIGFMSVGIISVGPFLRAFLESSWNRETTRALWKTARELIVVFGGVGLLLGYWIIPLLIHGDYHNISVWDGIWKFDSFGYREVLKNLLNGDLFDFGRFPILTILVIIGAFAALRSVYFPFALLFAAWILLYFGRTTWGGLFSLIPGMSEFHLSRFIVGVHAAGIFLIPLGFDSVARSIGRLIPKKAAPVIPVVTTLLFGGAFVAAALPQTIRYAAHNDFLIKRANTNFAPDTEDISDLFAVLRSRQETAPGRVFAGRGGSWGRNFRVAETPMYMYLSTYGIPVVLWLPETWSPNSDTEQYFSESNEAHYGLYNVRYVVTPTDIDKKHIQPFWTLTKSGRTWKLYEVKTDGYVTTGVRPAIVSAEKTGYRTLMRLWLHSDAPTQQLFPELTFNTDYPKQTGPPNFRMLDEVTYRVPDGSIHNIFAGIPRYVSPVQDANTIKSLVVTSQDNRGDMVFTASVDVPSGCAECLVILRQSFHPSWKATVDGKRAHAFAVFPFFTAVKLEEAGTHTVEFSYEPSAFKSLLLLASFLTLVALGYIIRRRH